MTKHDILLYFIMGSNNTLNNPEDILEAAIKGGITCFQFREKGENALIGSDKHSLASTLLDICHSRGVPFIVNDDVDLALAVKADGVHVGQDDTSLTDVKRRCPKSMSIGISAKTIAEAKDAQEHGADYLGVGPMYSTSTKEDAESPIGPQAIRQMREAGVTIPIVGIGGIDDTNAKDVMNAGADGISVISAISKAPNVTEASASLKRRLT
ncbi:thiamine-phosphate pyrophosphorylase [Salibacterium salarium]|uniref:thiamine phosphate synthase n=1 Tax=Salibacterium salarium TaxID=284579 RepID=UPI0027887A2D|nr:thiamine phosphate synthase [Salibacterium salarium]MDQ0299971.1 thiamine-phosphate pyrophosphorylase [Salibacterium salarium]